MKLPGILSLEGGQLINARCENLDTLPTFVLGRDEGRLLYVTSGADQGFWVGGGNGTSAFQRFYPSGHIAIYESFSNNILDGASLDITMTEASSRGCVRGFIAKVLLSTTLTSGQARVELFEDVALTSKFYDCYFDLSDQAPDRIATFFESDSLNGDVYARITNLSGSAGLFDLTIVAASALPAQALPPPGNGSGVNDAVAGEGVSYDPVNSRLDIDLKVNGGLELTGAVGSKKLGVKFKVGGGLTDSGTGSQLDPAVAVVSGENQSNITGLKLFSSPGFVPAGAAGPPAAGTHSQGEFYMDSNLDIWFCSVAGTPGTWMFWGWKEEKVGGSAVGTSYTGNIAPGASEILEIPTTGRRGFIRRLLLWGSDSAFAAVDVDAPYRVSCYPNENAEGREKLWTINGQVRKTYTTAISLAGANTITLNTVAHTNLDDLIRLRQAAGITEEFQRVTARDTGTLVTTVEETLVNPLAANDAVMFVFEFVDLPFRNNSGVTANSRKIYLKVTNDDPTSTLKIGYQVEFENVGGGNPY